jgi:hypothetical protein
MSTLTNGLSPEQPTNEELFMGFLGACVMIKNNLPGAIKALRALRARRTTFDGPADNALREMIDRLVQP